MEHILKKVHQCINRMIATHFFRLAICCAFNTKAVVHSSNFFSIPTNLDIFTTNSFYCSSYLENLSLSNGIPLHKLVYQEHRKYYLENALRDVMFICEGKIQNCMKTDIQERSGFAFGSFYQFECQA